MGTVDSDMRRSLFSHARALVAVILTLGVAVLSAATAISAPPPSVHQPLPGVSYGTESIEGAPQDALRVSPTRLTFDNVTPGSEHTASITIRNRRATPTRFSIDVVGLAGSRDPLRRVSMLAANDPANQATARSWITPAVHDVILQPRQFATIPIGMSVPAGARPGGHYAAVIVRAQGKQLAIPGTTGGRLGVDTELAVAVLATVPGTAQRSLRIVSITAPGLVTSRHQLHATVVVENSGDVHADPRGVVTIRSLVGSDIARTPLRTRTLLPRGRDRVELTWKHAPWIGRYTITASVGSGTNTTGDTAARVVWIMPPWWAMLIAAIAAAAGIGWIIRRRRFDD